MIRKIMTCILTVFVLFSCDVSKDDEMKSVSIKSVIPTKVTSAAPVESGQQINIEFQAAMGDVGTGDNLYSWEVKYIKPDVVDSLLAAPGIEDYVLSDENCFVETEKNGLSAVVSFYKYGYYLVKFRAENIIGSNESEIIIKHSVPDLEPLYIAFNIPKTDLNSSDYKGEVHMNLIKSISDASGDEVSSFLFSDIKDDWYKTDMVPDPFGNFTITSGVKTAVTDGVSVTKKISGFSTIFPDKSFKENMSKPNAMHYTYNYSKDSSDLNEYSFSKPDNMEVESDIYIGTMLWSVSSESPDREVFSYQEIKLNSTVKQYKYIFDDGVHLAKIFAGYVGHKVTNGGYYVFFNANGVSTENIDVKNVRPYPVLPYGALLGKLGKTGNVFLLGERFVYSADTTRPVYTYNGEKFIKM